MDIIKNPDITQQVITDNDPFDIWILAGTLMGAFGYVGLVFTCCYPVHEEESERVFEPPWVQILKHAPWAKDDDGKSTNGAPPFANRPRPLGYEIGSDAGRCVAVRGRPFSGGADGASHESTQGHSGAVWARAPMSVAS
jgi:hypothetical protein